MKAEPERTLDELVQAVAEARSILARSPVSRILTEQEAYDLGASWGMVEAAKTGPVRMADGSVLHVIDGRVEH